MSLKIAIVGKGRVGTSLSEGIERSGHQVVFVSHDPNEPLHDAAKWAEVVILAVPWTAHDEILSSAHGVLDDKIVVDVSNINVSDAESGPVCSTSIAEELQKRLPRAKIVKAFNTVFADNMKTGRLMGERLTIFVAGDGHAAKSVVRRIAEDIGFLSVDAGTLKSARYLEALGLLNITLGYENKMGTEIGFRLVKRPGRLFGSLHIM